MWHGVAQTKNETKQGDTGARHEQCSATPIDPTFEAATGTSDLTKLASGPSVLWSGLLAQDYLSKPVRTLIAFAPGDPADIIGRLLAQKLRDNVDGNRIVARKIG